MANVHAHECVVTMMHSPHMFPYRIWGNPSMRQPPSLARMTNREASPRSGAVQHTNGTLSSAKHRFGIVRSSVDSEWSPHAVMIHHRTGLVPLGLHEDELHNIWACVLQCTLKHPKSGNCEHPIPLAMHHHTFHPPRHACCPFPEGYRPKLHCCRFDQVKVEADVPVLGKKILSMGSSRPKRSLICSAVVQDNKANSLFLVYTYIPWSVVEQAYLQPKAATPKVAVATVAVTRTAAGAKKPGLQIMAGLRTANRVQI